METKSEIFQNHEIYIISGSLQDVKSFQDNLVTCLNGSNAYIQLRPKLESDQDFELELTKILSKLEINQLSRLLLNSGSISQFNKNTQRVKQLKLGGMHLTSDVLLNYPCLVDTINRKRADWVWAASCHEQKEIEMANALNLDMIVLSPVLPSTSCPSDNTLGWKKFEQLVKHSKVPVFGLGGLSLDHLDLVKKSGGQGIGAIKSFWNCHQFSTSMN